MMKTAGRGGTAQQAQSNRARDVLIAAAAAAIAAALAAVLAALWSASWLLGAKGALALLHEPARDVPGLEDWLRAAEGDLARVGQNRAAALASLLANAGGMTVEQLAAALAAEAGSLVSAEMIAWAELAKGQWRAALQVYRELGVMFGEWMTLHDSRVCVVCTGNQVAGPRLIGEAYPSGDGWPPAHPRCRCALLPVRTVSM